MEILSTTRLDSIDRMARGWGIDPGWDAIIVGDGSGGGWHLPTGWAGVLVDRAERGRVRFYGGMSSGTINIAELMPYVQAMRWYSAHRRRRADAGKAGAALCRVHVVTDHLAIAQEGTALVRGEKLVRDLGANRPDWAALMAFEWEGFCFAFHWIERATAALNVWSDEQAKICFRAMKEMPAPSLDGVPVSIHDCNADHDAATPLHLLVPKPPRGNGKRRPAVARDCPPDPAG